VVRSSSIPERGTPANVAVLDSLPATQEGQASSLIITGDDVDLFNVSKGLLEPISGAPFKLEKEIQELVEANLESLFNLEFVTSEFTCDAFRLDTLAFDASSNSFVIVEYKRGQSYSVVDQGYSYLSTMLNNKAEFILEYNERAGNQLKKNDVNWSSSRVIFVAPSFNSYQKNSINFSDVPFELWEIRRFEGNLIAFEQHSATSKESISNVTGGAKDSVITKVSTEVKVVAEKEHAAKLGEHVVPIWEDLRERLEGYSGTSFRTTKSYVSWTLGSKAICYIIFRKKELVIEIPRGNINSDGKHSKNFFNIDDPKCLLKEKLWNWKSGASGHMYEFRLSSAPALDYAVYLLEQKYKSLG
jgi:hypothetical protein